MTTSISPTFTAGGLASGLDTNSIIDSLVKIESRSVDMAKTRQDAFKAQISQVGDLVSRLTSFNTSLQALTKTGVLGVTQVGSASGYTATPSSSSTAGRYSILVDSVAAAAKAPSSGFTTGTLVMGSTLTIGVNGTPYDVTVADGSSLEMVAAAINTSGAPVSAAVLDSNGTRYLSVTNKDTGFTVGQPAASALTFAETITGATGQALGLSVFQPATNAKVFVDGLPFERTTNLIADALPGTTLSLQKITTTAEELVLTNDATSTQSNLQKFVDGYNKLAGLVRAQLTSAQTTDRSTTLAGDSSLRTLQQSLQAMVSGVLNPSATTLRTLADVGIQTGNDGLLTIDTAQLTSALSSDPRAVNALFQTASTGLGAASKTLTTTYTDAIDGILTSRTKGLNKSVKGLDDTISNLQVRVEGYRKRLVAQFAAMEKLVGSFKSIGNYLTQQETSRANASK
jgi:flagellar hook-associated protein 2